MSVDYASRLSEYENKGKCGLPEVRFIDYRSIYIVWIIYTCTCPIKLFHTKNFDPSFIWSYKILIDLNLQTFDPPDKLREKISVLCDMIRSSQHMVVHTGAGVSTAAGTIWRDVHVCSICVLWCSNSKHNLIWFNIITYVCVDSSLTVLELHRPFHSYLCWTVHVSVTMS